MRYWEDISNDELELAIRRKSSEWHPPLGHSNQGNDWFPWPIKGLEDVRSRLHPDLGEELKRRGIPRRQRTKNAIDRLVRELARNPAGAAQLEKTAMELYAELPVRASPDLTAAFKRFALGTISEFELKRTVVKAASDPLDLISHFAPRLNADRKLSSLVRDFGSQMEAAFKGPFEKVLEFAELSARLGRVEDAKSHLRSMFKDLRTKLKVRLIKAQIDERPNRSSHYNMSDEELEKIYIPNIDMVVNPCIRKLWSSAADVLATRKLQRWEMQDAGDLMHARYAPYADIFRCDLRWFPAISASAKPYRTIVVGRLRELIPAIELAAHRIS